MGLALSFERMMRSFADKPSLLLLLAVTLMVALSSTASAETKCTSLSTEERQHHQRAALRAAALVLTKSVVSRDFMVKDRPELMGLQCHEAALNGVVTEEAGLSEFAAENLKQNKITIELENGLPAVTSPTQEQKTAIYESFYRSLLFHSFDKTCTAYLTLEPAGKYRSVTLDFHVKNVMKEPAETEVSCRGNLNLRMLRLNDPLVQPGGYGLGVGGAPVGNTR